MLSDEELAAAEPERSRTMEITDFVDLGEIDPVYFRTTYYLAPQSEVAAKAYALLREAMQEARQGGHRHPGHAEQGVPGGHPAQRGRAGPRDDVLRRRGPPPRRGAAGARGRRRVSRAAEIDMAKLLVEAMAGWDPSRYQDTHRRRVEELVGGEAPGARDREPGRRRGRCQGGRPDGGARGQRRGPEAGTVWARGTRGTTKARPRGPNPKPAPKAPKKAAPAEGRRRPRRRLPPASARPPESGHRPGPTARVGSGPSGAPCGGRALIPGDVTGFPATVSLGTTRVDRQSNRRSRAWGRARDHRWVAGRGRPHP